MVFELCQDWRCGHFLGEPVPVLSHPPGEELFPSIQSKLPLTELHAIPSGPVTGHDRRDQCLPFHLPLYSEKAVDCDRILFQSPFLQAKQIRCSCMISPQDSSLSSQTSFECARISLYPSYTVGPKIAPSIRHEAAPAQSRAGQSALSPRR